MAEYNYDFGKKFYVLSHFQSPATLYCPFKILIKRSLYVLPQNKEYHGERVTLGTNLAQCTADNGTVCDPIAMKGEH